MKINLPKCQFNESYKQKLQPNIIINNKDGSCILKSTGTKAGWKENFLKLYNLITNLSLQCYYLLLKKREMIIVTDNYYETKEQQVLELEILSQEIEIA